MKKLNNKGYMLIEIILASAIAMGIAYFLINLTIKMKNKNDDIMVTTVVKTDQALIVNELLKALNEGDFDCTKLTISGNTFTYNEKKVTLSNYATFGTKSCSTSDDYITINIPIIVKQLPDEDFNIDIKWLK